MLPFTMTRVVSMTVSAMGKPNNNGNNMGNWGLRGSGNVAKLWRWCLVPWTPDKAAGLVHVNSAMGMPKSCWQSLYRIGDDMKNTAVWVGASCKFIQGGHLLGMQKHGCH